MTELEKMLKGELYDPSDDTLLMLRHKAHRLCQEYNALKDTETDKRLAILKEMGVKLGKESYLQGPIYFDYGTQISIGDFSYANFNLTILKLFFLKLFLNNNNLYLNLKIKFNS